MLFMRALWILVIVLLTGCSGQEQNRDTAAPEPEVSDYYSLDELRDTGLLTVDLEDEQVLLCGGADESSCVCMEPLPCRESGDCVSFDANIEAFRNAVKGGQGDRTVDCSRGETGRCEKFRYFYFEGDNHRFEMRWFDASGHLVAQRNWTDYREFCGGRTRARVMGRIPRCDTLEREEIICGEADTKLLNPIEDVLRYTRGAAKPE